MKKRLSELSCGESGFIIDIAEDIKQKIAGMGVRVGKELKVISKQPLKGPIVVMIDESKTSLSQKIADKIAVEIKE